MTRPSPLDEVVFSDDDEMFGAVDSIIIRRGASSRDDDDQHGDQSAYWDTQSWDNLLVLGACLTGRRRASFCVIYLWP